MDAIPYLRVHQFLPKSYSNGPGSRAVLWLQGCTLGCPGCFNPETHSPQAGKLVSIDDQLAEILAIRDQIEGITISGGEPLQQIKPLITLLEAVRAQSSLSVIVFTGFEWSELERMPGFSRLSACVDVLIAGRYLDQQRLASGLRGSQNKVFHLLTNRYSTEDLDRTPPAEVIIEPDGSIDLSGINPFRWTDR